MLSANTLFHFTGCLENLISILKDDFQPRFSLEDFRLVFAGRNPPVASLDLAIPMVSFCDIPLSQTQRHLADYGNYGIGMTKQWGKKRGITPVLYLHQDSLLVSKFGELLEQVREENLHSDFQRGLSNNLFDFACFVKPYEGTFSHNGTRKENYRFYDEREWRYVPVMSEPSHRKGMTKAEFLNEDIKRVANEKLAKQSTIHFRPSDISYLVVEREDEIVPFIKKVKHIKRYYHEDARELVASRVISAEQIRADF